MKKIIIFITMLTIIGVVAAVFYIEGALPVNRKDTSQKNFIIEREESVDSIISNLYLQQLIRNKLVFLFILKHMQIDSRIQAGEFNLSPSMSAHDIARRLTKGSYDSSVTIIEGLRKEEIAQIVANETDIPESEFIARSEEGRLFPDTYQISKTASLTEVLRVFQDNFNNKYNEELRNKAVQKGITDDEVLTLASIVEREAKSDGDKYKVASILYKRWKKDWALEVDASIQYMLGYQEQNKSWWKKSITAYDKEIDSPYNTYSHAGLPPGPICNPGLVSIEAVLEADESTPYWFYISNADGSNMHYAVTYEEHQENIRKYLR